MCENLISTTKWSGCSTTCNTTTAVPRWCDKAKERGTACPDPVDRQMGQRTTRVQCPNHRDEGYSQCRGHHRLSFLASDFRELVVVVRVGIDHWKGNHVAQGGRCCVDKDLDLVAVSIIHVGFEQEDDMIIQLMSCTSDRSSASLANKG